MNPRSSIERYVAESELTDARIARQWAGTEQRMAALGRARWQLPAALSASLVGAVMLVVYLFVRLPASTRVAVGTLVESADSRTITLNDGSRVDLTPHSRLRVNALEPQRVELDLERGSAVFDVPHLASRRFVVRAGRFDVIDVGTRFSVERLGPNSVTVAVEQGAVRVERRDTPEPARFLSAGERWSTSTAGPAEVALPDAGDATSASSPSPAASAGAPQPSASALPPDPPTSARAPTPGARVVSAKDILESAQRAQRAGRLGDAAAAYDRLRRTFRADARAGLAAFELGRLRLGSLADPRGAAEAFQDAIALSPGAPFRDDAEAHLVDALDAAGDTAGCQAARDAYLARYPRGLHAGNVSARCGRNP